MQTVIGDLLFHSLKIYKQFVSAKQPQTVDPTFLLFLSLPKSRHIIPRSSRSLFDLSPRAMIVQPQSHHVQGITLAQPALHAAPAISILPAAVPFQQVIGAGGAIPISLADAQPLQAVIAQPGVRVLGKRPISSDEGPLYLHVPRRPRTSWYFGPGSEATAHLFINDDGFGPHCRSNPAAVLAPRPLLIPSAVSGGGSAAVPVIQLAGPAQVVTAPAAGGQLHSEQPAQVAVIDGLQVAPPPAVRYVLRPIGDTGLMQLATEHSADYGRHAPAGGSAAGALQGGLPHRLAAQAGAPPGIASQVAAMTGDGGVGQQRLAADAQHDDAEPEGAQDDEGDDGSGNEEDEEEGDGSLTLESMLGAYEAKEEVTDDGQHVLKITLGNEQLGKFTGTLKLVAGVRGA